MKTDEGFFMPETKQIPLKNSTKCAIVDSDYYDWLTGFEWSLLTSGYAAYSTTVNGIPVNYLMHRLVNDTAKGMVTDHIDGDRLNNTRANLRTITNAENIRRQGLARDNKSGYKGVSWNKGNKCWQAKIRVNNKLLHVGSFQDPKTAAIAYNEAAKVHFGAFAYINEIHD